MITAEVRRHLPDAQDATSYETVLTLHADGPDLALDGDDRALSPSLPLVDPATGRQVRIEDNLEEWVRLLPTALRAGDYFVVITHDDNPEPAEAPSEEAQAALAALEIPEPEPHGHAVC